MRPLPRAAGSALGCDFWPTCACHGFWARRYLLTGLQPGSGYEVRVSYPATVSQARRRRRPDRASPICCSPSARRGACAGLQQAHQVSIAPAAPLQPADPCDHLDRDWRREAAAGAQEALRQVRCQQPRAQRAEHRGRWPTSPLRPRWRRRRLLDCDKVLLHVAADGTVEVRAAGQRAAAPAPCRRAACWAACSQPRRAVGLQAPRGGSALARAQQAPGEEAEAAGASGPCAPQGYSQPNVTIRAQRRSYHRDGPQGGPSVLLYNIRGCSRRAACWAPGAGSLERGALEARPCGSAEQPGCWARVGRQSRRWLLRTPALAHQLPALPCSAGAPVLWRPSGQHPRHRLLRGAGAGEPAAGPADPCCPAALLPCCLLARCCCLAARASPDSSRRLHAGGTCRPGSPLRPSGAAGCCQRCLPGSPAAAQTARTSGRRDTSQAQEPPLQGLEATRCQQLAASSSLPAAAAQQPGADSRQQEAAARPSLSGSTAGS
jgi:hypothetical protein